MRGLGLRFAIRYKIGAFSNAIYSVWEGGYRDSGDIPFFFSLIEYLVFVRVLSMRACAYVILSFHPREPS